MVCAGAPCSRHDRLTVTHRPAERHLAHGARLDAVGRPLRQTPMAQEILEVEQQFLQAGAGDVEQAQFGLRQGGRSAAALGDVLPP